MPGEKEDAACLWDMLDAARSVQLFIARRTFHDYAHDRLLRNAVERNVEIIGEAARGVSVSCREAHADIPWRGIIAQRHVLAHDYGEIDDERVWIVATRFIPELIQKLEPLVAELAGPDSSF